MTEAEYDAYRRTEVEEELAHPELQGPEWHMDLNEHYLPYQQADRPEPEPEAGQ